MVTTEEATLARPAGEILTRSWELVEPALQEAVTRLPSAMHRVAAYHFGWRDEHGAADHGPGGKALRPALCLLAAEAAGAPPAAGVPAAVAVELVHNFSLLHDDVMDGDTTRRHRPTAWAVFGGNTAILAGDALLTLALDVLATSRRPGTDQALRRLAHAVQQLIAGQSADLDFETRQDVTSAECVRMAEGKTAALLGCASALGALHGGGSERVEAMDGFGHCLGLAFQHVDDLLGIWGSPAATGKPVHSDLRSRKKSLPVVAALGSGRPEGEELAALYQRAAPLEDGELVRAAELVEAAGGRQWSRQQATQLLQQALRRLHDARPAPRPAAELAALARLVVERDH